MYVSDLMIDATNGFHQKTVIHFLDIRRNDGMRAAVTPYLNQWIFMA